MGTGDGIAQSSSWTRPPSASMTGSGPGIARAVSTRSIGKLANKCRVSRHLLNLLIRGFPLAKHSADAGRHRLCPSLVYFWTTGGSFSRTASEQRDKAKQNLSHDMVMNGRCCTRLWRNSVEEIISPAQCGEQ